MTNEEINQAYAECELELARKKNEVVSRLFTIRNNTLNRTYAKWLLDAIEFIFKEVK